MRLPRLVRVEWIDIVRSTSAWSSHQELEEMRPAECHSVGWLVKDCGDFIVLATNVAPDWKNEDLGILVAIPNCVIKKIVDQVDAPEDKPRPYPDWADEPDRCRICGSVCCDANHDYDRLSDYDLTDLE